MATKTIDNQPTDLNILRGIKTEIAEFENCDEGSSKLLMVKTVNEWMDISKNKKVPRKIFDTFWFEGEISFLFADTGLGKTILAVQIADGVSNGKPILGLKSQVKMQKVLYLDFELSEKQFENRYSNNYEDHYIWSDNFLRAEINTDAEIPNDSTFEEKLIKEIENLIISTGAKILIVDNITYLKSDNEQAKNALPFMIELKRLKKKYNLSILLLAHTPKRNNIKPLTRNDLSGSKMLINFCDSAFAIGESCQDSNLRYIKQIKVRNTNCVYDSNNVVLCRLTKSSNFIEFEFIDYCRESEHLRKITLKEKENRLKEAIQMKKDGMSNVQIAKALNVTEGAVRKWFKKNQSEEDDEE